jgi:predicted glycogen debranching enzyme
MISFGRGICGNFAESSEREWLETNGRGGYAMGAVCGANTRRYHALLTVPRRPPTGRFQTVNRVEESVFAGDSRHEISCQTYPGVIYPQGFKYLERFRLDPFPVWTYAFAGARLEKSFFLRYGEDTAVILYRLLSGPLIGLEVRPLFTCRPHRELTKEDGRFLERVSLIDSGILIKPDGGPDLFVSAQGQFRFESFWYRNQEYEWERRRGLDFREDAYSPGSFRFELEPNRTVALVFSTAERRPEEAVEWSRQEALLRRQVLEESLVRGPLADNVLLAADQFMVSRGDGGSVMAGYPWLEERSRDTLIAVPGICLATGRADDAKKILDTYSNYLVKGLLPARFPDPEEALSYASVDAPLWFVWAVQHYLKATRDMEAVKRWFPSLRQIAEAYQHGTLHGIHMDQDGLVAAGAPGEALTWMDARSEEGPVTPRSGKPVEVQALWYNALQFLAELELKLGEPSGGYDKLAGIARQSFNEKFWNEAAHYLYDRIEGRERDAAIRPNALFAISLPYEILEENRFRAVVDTAWSRLYTTYGLRSLSPEDSNYHGKYSGPSEDRARSRHQGGVWSWLLGTFLTCYAKAYGESEQTKSQMLVFLQPFLDHVAEELCLGNVSELFEGDPPHSPRGCPAYASGVAEALRVLWEENLVI